MSFEGFMGDLRKKISCRLPDFEKKKHTKKFLGKTISCTEKILLMTYTAEKSSYTVICGGKKFLTLQRFGKKQQP